MPAARAGARDDEPSVAAAAEGVGEYRASRFVVRRTLAFCYCGAFLSLAAQAEGLFGCDGPWPAKAGSVLARLPGGLPASAALTAAGLLGGAVSGAAFVAPQALERNAVAVFTLLWVLFACSTHAAPGRVFQALEDRLLLEVGLVAVPLLMGPGDATSGVGRSLAAWLLFRAVFAGGARKAAGPCEAWRQLTALADSYQLEPFPLPTAWLLWLAPPPAQAALACFELYVEVALSLLVLVPARSVRVPAVFCQLAALATTCALTNRGVAGPCLACLCFALMDDAWHSWMWSETLLASWGCAEDDEEADEGEGAAERPAGRRGGLGWSCLAILAGLLGCLAAAFGPLAPLLPREAVRRAALGAAAAAAAAVSSCALGAALRRSLPGGGARAAALAAGAAALWLAGGLQLARDLCAQGRVKGAPAPLVTAWESLEAIRLASPLGAALATEPAACPHPEGGATVAVQGLLPESTDSTGRPETAKWHYLSSRHLPGSDERRPAWLQPYTPRLDRELWRLAQKPQADGKVPAWLHRLAAAVALRQGGAAQLSAGPWQGVMADLYGKHSEYSAAVTPLPAVRIVRLRHTLVQDVHSNKWWNATVAKVAKTMGPESEELARTMSKLAACTPAPWAEMPLAEALLAAIVAALLWKLVVQGAP